MAKINPDTCVVITIDAPEWYARKDFLSWLRNPSTATWDKQDPSQPPTEMSDAFIWVDSGLLEGSDFGAMLPFGLPTDIEQDIQRLIRGHMSSWKGGFVRIRNMPMCNDEEPTEAQLNAAEKAFRCASDGDECPLCRNGTVEIVDGEVRCQSECGNTAEKES